MICPTCNSDVSDEEGCPQCATSIGGNLSEPTALISEDFLLGNTRSGLERIRARLLDLTNRNKLLNFRHTQRSSLSIVGVLPDSLFDTLLDGGSVSFRPVPESNSNPKPKASDHARQLGLLISLDLPEPSQLPVPNGEVRPREIQTLLYPNDLEASLRRIAYSARTAIEESGTNMLHLVFGFLEWFESESSDEAHLAPLLLVPVAISKGKPNRTFGTFSYEISYSSVDALEENLSLREKLKRDFGLDMPSLSEDETPERYFKKFSAILATKPRWRVRRRITLGLLHFGKLLMFRDLDPKNWPKGSEITEHPRVKDFFEGAKQSESTFADEYEIDDPDQQDRIAPLVHDADSSQHSALIDAVEGRNLVIEGPPGTGKSQTITNLIAATLAHGKTVLFVSEKLAALEVVRRRLDQANLGIFCLELHSHKTEKRRLLDDLQARLDATGSFFAPKDLKEKINLLERAKRQLIDYVELINTPFSALGCTGFDVIWRRERFRQELKFDCSLIEPIVLTRSKDTRLEEFESDCQCLEIYSKHVAALLTKVPALENHPWHGISNADLDYAGERELLGSLEEIRSAARQLMTTLAHFSSSTGYPIKLSSESASELVSALPELPEDVDIRASALLSIAGEAGTRDQLRAFIEAVTAWRKEADLLRLHFGELVRSESDQLERLHATSEAGVAAGFGDFERADLREFLNFAYPVCATLLDGATIDRQVLVKHLQVCEGATFLKRYFGTEYRRARHYCAERFSGPKRVKRAETIKLLSNALSLVDKIRTDIDSNTKQPVTLEMLRNLVEIARAAAAVFDESRIPDNNTLRTLLGGILRIVESRREQETLEGHNVRSLITAEFRGVRTDLNVLSEALHSAESIRKSRLSERVKAWIFQADSGARLRVVRDDLRNAKAGLERLNTSLYRFNELGGVESSKWWGPTPELGDFDRLADRALSNKESLASWLDFQRTIEQVKASNLDELAAKVYEGKIQASDLIPAYRYTFYNTLAHELTHNRPELFRFSGLTQSAIRERFVQYDKEIIGLNREAAAALISSRNVPHGVGSGPVGRYTERALIVQEIGKKKRHIPIRQLVSRAGIALQALKPCFMMGPLSVAQYLAPGRLRFDLVVMDEASQLKPEDALGSVARGGQLVIVGDPKQLPPTDFFQRQVDNDDEDEEDKLPVEEHESILDVAGALYQPIRQLRWHYRSRHDSLIAFSNQEFYRGRLIVFPSPFPERLELGVAFQHIPNGCYEAGGARWNRPEAERIVEAVLDHIRNYPELSLGVVALNYQQRGLIEDLLNERTRDDEIAQAFIEHHAEASEPFFIKNLENVQGDERDVILISITYGRDQNGKLSQQFGPINKAHGPRRLNVLFTRAKHRVVVFSTINPDELRLDENTPKGILVLKSYLDYARTGRLATPRLSGLQPGSDFEIAVSGALMEKGYECVGQVGVAGFFIDIAVRHPTKPGVFVLGIECDGASYHSAKSARDRDRLRQTILEHLGWNIHRVWSTDWFRNSRSEVEKIVTRIKEILATEQPDEPNTSAAASSHQLHVSLFGGAVCAGNERAPATRNGEAIAKSNLDEAICGSGADLRDVDEVRRELVTFRENVIKKEYPEADPARGLLRKSMLEALLRERPLTKAEWLARIPYGLRSNTDAEQVGRYLAQVFDIISKLS